MMEATVYNWSVSIDWERKSICIRSLSWVFTAPIIHAMAPAGAFSFHFYDQSFAIDANLFHYPSLWGYRSFLKSLLPKINQLLQLQFAEESILPL